jgi:EAL domain-containing protein (putative c-di-GMP-specific phosphodiesterase class I)
MLKSRALESELRHAIQREEFVVHYQPCVDLRTGRIVAAEALVRWQHPQRGLLGPGEFLATAADTGMIRSIDEWMLKNVCKQNVLWQSQGMVPIRISMNVSNSLFHGNSMLRIVEDVFGVTGIDPGCVELEFTESIVMRNWDSSIGMLQRLKFMGVQLSIDDFGTGVSSLTYLQRMPVNLIKIDRSLIIGAGAVSELATMVRAIIAVERTEQKACLIAEACDQAQGYLFGRPMPAAEFAEFVALCTLPKAS